MRAACLLVSSLSVGDITEKKNKRARDCAPQSRGSAIFGPCSLEPRNHHKGPQKLTQTLCVRMQRIARRMSSPLLFHNRQFLMATAGGSVDNPIEEAIRGKVSNLLHCYPAPDPPVVSAH